MRAPWLLGCVVFLVACGTGADDSVDLRAATDSGGPSLFDGGAVDSGNRDFTVPDGGDAVLVPDVGGLDPGAPKLQVTMVDVGQGDGLVVRLPGGLVLAVDGGPSSSAYSDALKALGVSKLDYAVLSHAHSDHYTGLTPAITALMPMDCMPRVFDPGLARTDTKGYTDWQAAVGCRYQTVGIGKTLNLDPSVELSVLSAHDKRFGANDDSHGINNTSVILRLRFGRFSMLFEGDAEKEAEQDTATNFPMLLPNTILKAGHHGSCTASGHTYLNLVSPQFVLMSMSDGNSYGMPHCQTMAKLKARPGLRWARTDVNGNITVATDGAHYAVTLSKGKDSVETCPRDCATPLDF